MFQPKRALIKIKINTECPKKIVPFSKFLFLWAPDVILKLELERRVFQSKLGVSSSNQCNLHHFPHTGHLEKKYTKDSIFFGHPV
jgi:hypothetical protein